MFRIFAVISIGFIVSCSNEPLPVDCLNSGLQLNLIQVKDASDCGIADGQIRIEASGGSSPYQYAIIGKTFQPDGQFNALTPGIYSFVVNDKNDCRIQLGNVILMAADISFTAMVTDNTNCVGGNGSITITMTGGTPPFQFKFGMEDFDEVNSFSGLEEGTYPIMVKDDAGCSAELLITVGQGITNTSWSTEILPIIQNSCAVSGCHNGVVRSDLRIYSNAKANAALIKTYTQNGYMPFEGTITADEKAKIACWIDEGALEN